MSKHVSIEQDNLPVIALVGRVNVGKSTLFNTLIETGKAIVSSEPGTTRTSNTGVLLWRGKSVRVIDTGGLTFSDDVPLEEAIIAQSEAALEQADAIFFVTSAQDGILPQELELARRLRRKKEKLLFLLANKADSANKERRADISEWLKLGMGAPYFVSASNGRKIGDFLDVVYTALQKLPTRPKKFVSQAGTRIALVGKPNVGKSSLFNKLVGQEQVIVSDMAHTTREPHDTTVVYDDGTKKHHLTFVDTAGIRRKAKVTGSLEREGIHRSIKAIDEADIVLFVIDGNESISSQDKQLGGLIEKHAKSAILLVNKWDLADETDDAHRNAVKQLLHREFPHLRFAPILFVSGKTGHRVHTIFPELLHVANTRALQIPARTLEQFLDTVQKEHRPSRGKGTRHPKILGIKQIGVSPPVIELIIKFRTSLHSSYTHFIENKLREQFDVTGTPIIIRLRKERR